TTSKAATCRGSMPSEHVPPTAGSPAPASPAAASPAAANGAPANGAPANIDLAIIGGTGLYRLAQLEDPQASTGDTPFGAASGPVRLGRLGERRIAFLARHGEEHSIPPHRINYRANLWRLHALGARRIVAVNAVGGISARMGPRVLALPDQLIDYTHGRDSSFCDV